MSKTDPWAGEKLSRSEAQRRYNNIVIYQLRPMLGNRSLSEEARVNVCKRLVREASRIRYESGVVAGSGTREEVVELLQKHFHPESGTSAELLDWMKRVIRAFGATIDTGED